MPVADEFGVKPGASPIRARGQCRGAYQPPGFGRAGGGLGGMAQGKQSDAVFCRRQCQPPAGNQIENPRSAPGFDHHRAKASATQGFRTGAQNRRRIGRFHGQKARGIDAKIGKAGGKNAAPFCLGKILLHPEQPFVLAGNTGRHSQSEPRCGRCITCRHGENFMQSATWQSAIQAGIRRGMAQRAELSLRQRDSSSEAPAQVRRQFLPFFHDSGTYSFVFCSNLAPDRVRVKPSNLQVALSAQRI